MKELDHGYLALLVAKTREDDMDAFTELYSLTHDKVYNYARHYLRDDFLAQDAVQEIYILVLNKLHTLKDPLLFIAWLNQISFRVCYDTCRKNDTKYGTIDDEFLESFCDEHPSSNPEAQFAAKEEKELLRKAIENLPELQRSIVVMRYFNNLKLEDIANAMDISLSTVKRTIERAKDNLHHALSRDV